MHIISSAAEMTAFSRAEQRAGHRVGFVPTMGALHEGHLSLVRAARAQCDVVVVSIFVNPTQFGPNEDLAKYPRSFEQDKAMLESGGVSAIFYPSVEEMYPAGATTWVAVEGLSERLDGRSRPGHFRGVSTVVSKLFNIVQPQFAFFGQKDAAQVAVIRRMVRDLNFDVQIVVCPIVREQDGLAMSSRNAYLNMAQREAAGVIYRALRKTSEAYDKGERLPANLRSIARSVLETEPLAEIDYIAINDPRTLFGIHDWTDDPLLLSMVVKIGKPRLLDNCLLPWSFNDRAGLTSLLGV